ncbi:COX15/CtaA family protein [Microbulbifer variabilis]|uniref:COX15/CtaA family protein n=1 Tax=Microbulbifer variabilis TaxID=266805 RepID=UPI001CFF342A|nr:COX15/CtaA family protein [Microbulbifer variabilis]
MDSSKNRDNNQVIGTRYGWRLKLALGGCALAIVVVVLGAFTRLADAGLGCPDWPGCYGHLTWPDESHEIQAANHAYPDAPVDNNKTWPEMVHRYFAGTLLLLVIFLVYLSWNRSKQRTYKHTLSLMALIIMQAAFGMWTVTLKLWPQVVTAHLLGGMATLSILWLLTERMRHGEDPAQNRKYQTLHKLLPLAILTALTIALQIALGGWTSSNYAALACPDFPTCHGQWLPQADFEAGFNIFQKIGPNYLGGALESDARTAIHLSHRFGALLVTVMVLTLSFLTWRAGSRRWAIVLSTLIALQVGLGIANIVMFLPLPIAVAHNAGAALLLLGTITFCYRIYSAKPIEISENIYKTNNKPNKPILTGNMW